MRELGDGHMRRDVSKRWEDVTPIWTGPFYGAHAIKYSADVQQRPLSSRLITCVDVVDWDGDSGRDVLLSNWDACYDGAVFLAEDVGRHPDGTPRLATPQRIDGVTGYVTGVRDRDGLHLISTSRLRRALYFYRNIGTSTAPKFGLPQALVLDADWVKGGEYLHVARFADIDGDGRAELIVGTDYWNDYWPHGIEWNEAGYRAYDAAGRWLGGPLRGFLYVFRNRGTLAQPEFDRGEPLCIGDIPVEVYGQLAPAAGDLRGTGAMDIVCGEFLDVLHFLPNDGKGKFSSPNLVRTETGLPLQLDHCIHFPCVVDWDGDGVPDLLVGAEDGYVNWVRGVSSDCAGAPSFEHPRRLLTDAPEFHAGVLPVPWVHDWRGDGRMDLVVGNSAGELLFYPAAAANDPLHYLGETHLVAGGEPVRVRAGDNGSIQGPSERNFAYTCPSVCDWDRDGRPDLLVSDIFGRHVFYRQRGSRYPPEFEAGEFIRYQRAPLKTVWRVRPVAVDWQSDGRWSYLTLDEHGALATYSQMTATQLADKRQLRWDSGDLIRFTEDVGGGLGRMVLCTCDWTGTGSIDVIVGTHGRASVPPGPTGWPRHHTGQAAVLLLENVGSNAEPRFAPPRPICLDREPIAMGMHTCAPQAVDLDGTGAPGLLVGVEDGSIVWLPRARLSW